MYMVYVEYLQIMDFFLSNWSNMQKLSVIDSNFLFGFPLLLLLLSITALPLIQLVTDCSSLIEVASS